jgi:hypothetical protein
MAASSSQFPPWQPTEIDIINLPPTELSTMWNSPDQTVVADLIMSADRQEYVAGLACLRASNYMPADCLKLQTF